MVNIVIAGCASGISYSECEKIGDILQECLPDFRVTKIIIQENEWDEFIQSLSTNFGWQNLSSPVIWRELGGTKILIGGSNDFKEYALDYYSCNIYKGDNKVDLADLYRRTLEIKCSFFKRPMICERIVIIGAESIIGSLLARQLAQRTGVTGDCPLTVCLLASDQKFREDVEKLKKKLDAFAPYSNVQLYERVDEALVENSIIVITVSLPRKSFINIYTDCREFEDRNSWLIRRLKYFELLARNICDRIYNVSHIICAGSDLPLESAINFDVKILLDNLFHYFCKYDHGNLKEFCMKRRKIIGFPGGLEYFIKQAFDDYFGKNDFDFELFGNIDNLIYVEVSCKDPLHVTGRALFKLGNFFTNILPQHMESLKSDVEKYALIQASSLYNFLNRTFFEHDYLASEHMSLVMDTEVQDKAPPGTVICCPIVNHYTGKFLMLNNPSELEKLYLEDAWRDFSAMNPEKQIIMKEDELPRMESKIYWNLSEHTKRAIKDLEESIAKHG